MQTLIPLILVMGGMMFFMSRSQKKQQAQRQQVLDSMQPGSEVVTIGGLYGIVHEVDKDKGTVTLDCEGIYLEFERGSIRTVKAPTTPTTTEEVVEVVEPEVEVTEVEVVEEPTSDEEKKENE
ncbi:preprotein translocase subunit YajC [Vagococcus sp. JNUCC 83]